MMSLVHSQRETVALEVPIPVEPPIRVIEKYFERSMTEHSHYVGTVRVVNDSDFYDYRVWVEYTVNGVTGSDYISLDAKEEGILHVEFTMPDHDVEISMEIYAEVIHR